MKDKRICFALFGMIFIRNVVSLEDLSNCSIETSNNCKNCVPYSFFYSNGFCQSCSIIFTNCQYCSSSGCEQCMKGYTLTVLDIQGILYCSQNPQCYDQGNLLSRFNQKIFYCVVSAFPSSTNVQSIILAVILSIICIVCVLSASVIIIKKRQLRKNAVKVVEHNSCSLCKTEKEKVKADEKEVFDSVNILPCGGFLCKSCKGIAKNALTTGNYSSCKICERLVTWYITPPIENNNDNNNIPQTDHRLNINSDNNGSVGVENRIEIINEDNCVICLKNTPITTAIIPCLNKPKHKLHDKCLGDFYNAFYQNTKKELVCPCCRTKVEV